LSLFAVLVILGRRCCFPYAAAMRRIPALLLLLSSLAAAPAIAQTQIHRCIGADGNPVFTDQPCAALQATPVARTAPSTRENVAPPPAVLCATDRDALKRAVIDAFADRDANRMAGLMLWGGYGQHAAVADIRALQKIMREPLLDLEPAAEATNASTPIVAADAVRSPTFAAASAASSSAVATPAPDNMLVLHTSASDGRGSSRELRFMVVHRSGCVWLRRAD
jgi:hypothetical protein